MKSLSEYLNKLEAVANAATEGPWEECNGMLVNGRERIVCSFACEIQSLSPAAAFNSLNDQAFVNFARTAIPKLVKIVRYLYDIDGWADENEIQKILEAK